MKRVLTVCGSPAHWRSGESQPYEEALRAAGIEPVLISPGTFAGSGDAIPQDMSGLLLMGGSDVNPARYGEARHSETQESDDASRRSRMCAHRRGDCARSAGSRNLPWHPDPQCGSMAEPWCSIWIPPDGIAGELKIGAFPRIRSKLFPVPGSRASLEMRTRGTSIHATIKRSRGSAKDCVYPPAIRKTGRSKRSSGRINGSSWACNGTRKT